MKLLFFLLLIRKQAFSCFHFSLYHPCSSSSSTGSKSLSEYISTPSLNQTLDTLRLPSQFLIQSSISFSHSISIYFLLSFSLSSLFSLLFIFLQSSSSFSLFLVFHLPSPPSLSLSHYYQPTLRIVKNNHPRINKIIDVL